MTTVATPPRGATDPDGPEPTVDQVDAGIDDDLVDAAFEDLVDAAFEDLDDDPVVASLQADRDRLAACGDMDAARAHHRRVEEMRQVQAVADRAAKLDALTDLVAEHDVEAEVRA